MPRQGNPPQRFTSVAIAHVAATVNVYYRPICFVLIDTAAQQLRERFGDSVGLIKHRSIEHILLSGTVDDDVLALYTELEVSDLKLQLQLFRRKRPTKSVDETASALRAMVQETRGEYCELGGEVGPYTTCVPSVFRCVLYALSQYWTDSSNLSL